MTFQLHLGDCLEILMLMPDNSVDSIITDPPYGLSFMNHHWDYAIPGVDVWAECFRVLKPGGHLLSFAGTRTQHRMAVNIEDAGFEIRDMIAWVYGSGFPKSLDVSKAIDKAAGAEREVVGKKENHHGEGRRAGSGKNHHGATDGSFSNPEMAGLITAPATNAARQWQGWGTALKPALETVTVASKPYTPQQERDIILFNLIRLEARLWLLSLANVAESNSTSNQSEYDVGCDIAQWSAAEVTNTRDVLCAQMGTSLFESGMNIGLNTVSSWRRTLTESWKGGNTSTIETKLSTTIDLRTLKFSLSQITPGTIIQACSLPGGFYANASTAENHFNASLSLLQSTLTLFVTERVISQEAEACRGAGVAPNLDPCVVARKPLSAKTVAANVQQHGTGAINIDACRVPLTGAADAATFENNHRVTERLPADREGEALGLHDGGWKQRVGEAVIPTGRWPANLIHDGSEEVAGAFPNTKSGYSDGTKNGVQKNAFGKYGAGTFAPTYGDEGNAARFFYAAKASRKDRNAGNDHPTVKPTDLMRYLCRLVTPAGGIVLDPFLGSGSTGKAAMLEGFRFIGIEMDTGYMEIARARIEHAAGEDLV